MISVFKDRWKFPRSSPWLKIKILSKSLNSSPSNVSHKKSSEFSRVHAVADGKIVWKLWLLLIIPTVSRFTTAWCAHAGCLLVRFQSANSLFSLSQFRNELIFDISNFAFIVKITFFQFVLILFSTLVRRQKFHKEIFQQKLNEEHSELTHNLMFSHERDTRKQTRIEASRIAFVMTFEFL